jgi:cytochrome c peroxidase
MPKFGFLSFMTVTVCLLATSACGPKGTAPVVVDSAKLALFAPLPDTIPPKAGGPEQERITLGRMLYYDPRLSSDQKVSCNSCHKLDKYGVDNEPTSTGFKGQHGDRNSPSVYNAAAHFAQFWDGRAADVEEQAKGPILNPVEMAAASDKQVVAVLKSMPEYVAAFKAAFPADKNPVTFDNVAIAIGTFERRLLTPARWDKFLKGDANALTNEEKAGFVTFTDAGCQMCHAGPLLGGNLYQKLGTVKPYPDTSAPGRMKVTKNEADRMVFKVPSLRNVAMTGPYFHNGKVATLPEAVSQMAEYQLGKQLTPEQVNAIVAWMKSLTGEIPADYIKPPELPKSTKTTPKAVSAD